MKEFALEHIDKVAEEVLGALPSKTDAATIVALSGELGAGKTTLSQAIGKKLGVKEKIISPTFVIMKRYPIRHTSFDTLFHIDAYRLSSSSDIEKLGLREIMSHPRHLVLIEWPERIQASLPHDALFVALAHHDEHKRKVALLSYEVVFGNKK